MTPNFTPLIFKIHDDDKYNVRTQNLLVSLPPYTHHRHFGITDGSTLKITKAEWPMVA